MYDTIIIGAGMSGLAAGIRLAHYDQQVCILERHYTIGGLNSFYRLNGRDHDVGLHAVTNYSQRNRKGPMARMLRQLRFRREDFALAPQIGSAIVFPEVRLQFGNDFKLMESEIHRNFPDQKDNLSKLRERIVDYDELDQETYELSARAVVSSIITDRLLVEMLFCPLMWYGNARERDMHFGQFCIMFRSIFLEGLARPFAGVRLILKNLVRRFRSLGGELKLRNGVQQIVHENGRATGIVLDSGEQIEAKNILSSAGWFETLRMCRDIPLSPGNGSGQLSFFESISVLDRQPQSLGHDRTIVFFNDSEQFHWEKPQGLCDARTGVICSPNNYLYLDDQGRDCNLKEGVIRITSLANFDRWQNLPERQYTLEKLHWYDHILESSVRFVPDFRRYVVDTDMFSPRTIRRFTWHDNGAVYGASHKHLDGTTPLKNLYVCGTDQGYVGIIGCIVSGILVANRYCLLSA